MKEYMSKLGKMIIELRTKRAWTQEQLAQIADVSPRTVQRLESGKGASMETLKAISNAFEMDVADLQKIRNEPETKENKFDPNSKLAIRITTGKELFNLIGGADGHRIDYDEPEIEKEASEIGYFLDNVKNVGEIWEDLDPSRRIEYTILASRGIKELEKLGYWVFGSRLPEYFKTADNQVFSLSIVNIGVFRSINPAIKKAESLNELYQELTKLLKLNDKA
jgi:transcriptional regulator with XRE-family HTH domain